MVMSMEDLLSQDQAYVLNTYKRMDLCVESTSGSYLTDVHGNRYLDMVGGIAVNGLGYNNPEIRDAITDQLSRYIHLSNYFASPPVVGLAKQLAENSFASKTFFTNSGTEAVEAALKLVRKHGKSMAADKTEVLSLKNSFHGRTFGGMTLTGQDKYKDPFGPVVPDIRHVTINDPEDLKEKVSDRTCAVFLEIIQGESGVRPLSPEFVASVVELKQKHGFCIVVDEIQTGLGRTGELFAYQHYDLIPDVMTIGKSLGGGLPLGAMLVSRELENVLARGDHGSTFGGNPVACAAGQVVLQTVSRPGFLAEVRAKGQHLIVSLEKMRETYPDVITEVRGAGLMLGIEAGDYASAIQRKALQRGMLLNVTNGTVIRLLPPLTISHPELDDFLKGFAEVLAGLGGQNHA
jgi:acetylornithine/N-succinyldiaminopimelate aminotransferase